jgi:DNA-binding MarR family transcriptional regulator
MTRRHNDLFKLPNDIFQSNLTATELTVLAAVYSLRSRSIHKGKKYIKINQKSLATICGFKATATISKAMDKLCCLGYIERIDRYYDDYKKLGAYVYTIPVVKGRKFFFVNRRIFKYKLSTAQMRMYLYCCKCAASHSQRFWNSYNDICRELNLKRSAVIKTISELISVGLIKRYRIRKKDGSFSDNHYRIVTLKPPKRKFRHKKRRCRFAPCIFLKKSPKIRLTNKLIINQNLKKVNTFSIYFFDLRGSPKIFSTLYSTHSYTNRDKKNIKLYLKYRCNLRLCHKRLK